MSAPAYLPLFGSDYLADTRHLSTEEHGAYILLMLAAWRQDDCSLPLDDKKLARITGLSTRKWMAVRDTILEFWEIDEGRITQARLLKEWRFAAQKSDTNRKSAEARWGKQVTENIKEDECERISECNAPQPQPHKEEEPNGSPSITPELENGDAPPRKARTRTKAEAKPSHRIPEDWAPGPLPPDVAGLVDAWPEGRLAREVEQFRDYWLDRPERRPGWDRSFHRRIRDIHDRVLREAANDRASQNRGYSQFGAGRENRDGVAKALDRRFGFDDPAGSFGRQDAGDSEGNRFLAVARPARLP